MSYKSKDRITENFKKILLLNSLIIFFWTPNLYASDDPYTKIAKELSKYAHLLEQPKVAIIPFIYTDKRTSNGGTIVAERLTTRIAKLKKFQVIERQLIEKVLQELHFETTGIVDVETTKQLGKILGVDAIITGTLLDIERGKVEVNARIIKTETAEVIGASSVEIEKIWTDISPTQPGPIVQQPAETLPPVYTQPPIYAGKADVFFDIFSGFCSGKMDLTFKNDYYPIDEVDVSFDLNGNGILEHSVTHYKIGFSGLATESSAPLGFRIGGEIAKPIWLFLEMSYISHYIKKQDTQVTLNDTSTLNFKFFVNDYLKVNTWTLLGDVFLQFSDKTIRPYVGLGLGITFNTVISPYIYQYHGKVFNPPLDELAVGFLFRFPVGMRIVLDENISMFAEYRYSINSFSFSRGIKNELDNVLISIDNFLFGLGLKL